MRPSTCLSSLPRRGRSNFEACRTSGHFGFVAGLGSSHRRGCTVKGATDIFWVGSNIRFLHDKAQPFAAPVAGRPSREPGGLWSNGGTIAVTLRCRFRSQLSVGRFTRLRKAWFVVLSGMRPTVAVDVTCETTRQLYLLRRADRLLPILILRSFLGGAGHCRRSPFKVVADAFNSSAACRSSCLARSA